MGIIFVDLSPGYNADLMSYLFGSILAVSTEDLIFMSVLDTVFVLFALLFYTQICAFCFDSEFAKLRGVNVSFLYYLMSLLIALCVVSTIRVVGLILVIALLSIPPYIAEKFSPNLAIMMVLSAILSAIFIFCGLILSYYFDLTSGASIIAVATIIFFIVEFCKRR